MAASANPPSSYPALASSSAGSSSSSGSHVTAALSSLQISQPPAKPSFGVIVPSKGEPSLLTLFDSVKSYFQADDEILVVVNGRVYEPKVQAIVAEFNAKEEHKWTLTVKVVDTETTTAALRNVVQNSADTCPQSSHLIHLHTHWAFLPGILKEMRSMMASHPLQDVILFQEQGPVMDACGALLPNTRVWRPWDASLEADPVKQASTFLVSSLQQWPAERMHQYLWVRNVVEAPEPREFARFALESSTYHNLQIKALVLKKYGTYDPVKRYWVIDYDNAKTGGMNTAFERDPAPGVVKTWKVLAFQNGAVHKFEFSENHAGPIHIELGPL